MLNHGKPHISILCDLFIKNFGDYYKLDKTIILNEYPIFINRIIKLHYSHN